MKNLLKILFLVLMISVSSYQRNPMVKVTDQTYGICPAYNEKKSDKQWKKLSRQLEKKVSIKVKKKGWWNSF